MNRRVFIASALATVSCRRTRPRLNVYNWSDYIAPDTLPNFEREFGVEVRYGTFESTAEMLAKVMTGNSGWDVVFPPAEYLEPMRNMNLLAPLRHEWLPNLNSIDAEFRQPPWDPELRWSIPYMHGTTGIVYQRNAPVAPRSWATLWDERLAGKITMLDDSAEVLGACLKMLGYPLNSADPDQLNRAQVEAIRQKKIVRAYLNVDARDQLVAGDVMAGQLWSVTAGQAIAGAAGRLSFALPSEGFARYADNMAVLRESGRAELAHKFIDYLLRGEVARDIVLVAHTATANGAAHRLLPDAIRNDPVLYPPSAELTRGEWFTAQSAASQRLRDRLWTEIKSSA